MRVRKCARDAPEIRRNNPMERARRKKCLINYEFVKDCEMRGGRKMTGNEKRRMKNVTGSVQRDTLRMRDK